LLVLVVGVEDYVVVGRRREGRSRSTFMRSTKQTAYAKSMRFTY
jgi:hypothetical protein